MKSTILAVFCGILAVCAFGAGKKAAQPRTSITESELRAMSKAKPNATDAGTLYQVGMATNNVERKQEFFKASAACLLACGKYDTYKKYIKGRLSNAKAFEDSLKDKCKKCGGAGRKDRKCYVCSGRRMCPSCKGSGRTVLQGLNGSRGSKSCYKCKGGGACPKCGGGGFMREKCASCGGTGKRFQQSSAERVFRDTCIAIADRPAVEARAKAEAAARERKRIEEEERKRKRIAAETRAKTEAEERRRKRMAETNGDADKLFKRGLAYSLGVDVQQDFHLAMEYYSDASELGYLPADAVLALMYLEGQGCELSEQSLTKCFIHAKKAATCDDEATAEGAKYALGRLYITGFRDEGGQYQRDAGKAYHYFSSCKNNGEALFIKGLMEYHGLGTLKDASKAESTFKTAAKCTKEESLIGRIMLCLGYLHYTRASGEQDYQVASMMLLIGASAAFPELMQTAKSPLSECDRARHKRFLLGGGSPAWTALNIKLFEMCKNLGRGEICGVEVNIINKALLTLFNPDCWKGTGVQYDFISRLSNTSK